MNIVTEYPTWFLIFCIAAGVGYSFLLYRKDSKFKETSKNIVRVMALFRLVVVTLLCFLLLSPLLKNIEREVEKPVIIIAEDNSESILATKDSAYFKTEYKKELNSLVNTLSEKYDVKRIAFGDKVSTLSSFDSLKFKDKQTNISSLFDELTSIYSNRNVGAIVLASDGLYNQGLNPVYAIKSLNVPVYAIALGDTAVRKDLILTRVDHNRLAYLGNQFPLEITVNAKQLQGKTSTLTVSKDGTNLFSKLINFNSDAYRQTIPLLLEAKQTGLQHYKIKLSGVQDEVSLMNNNKDIFIDVLDAREKILILCDAPHPDVAAIKDAIEINQNYEVESYTIDNFDKSLKKYNLVILHQLPSSRNPSSKILTELNASAIPVWSFSGATAIIKNDISKPSMIQKSNEAEPVLDANFPLFTLSDEFRSAIKSFPAVTAPFGSYQNDKASDVLLYQRIGIVETKTPLMLFNSSNASKMAVFTGEGIWKWRLYDFAVHGNHTLFNEFVSKTVQYLSVKENKSFFKIVGKNNFMENEPIELEAEVYNQSYELINDPEVNIVITNSENANFSFAFSKTSNAYRLNAGMFPVGEYKYNATVKVGEKIYTQKGMFSILPLQVELTSITADHQLLFNLASKRNGEMVYPKNIQSIAQKLIVREDIKSISYSQKKLTDLINLKWIFFLLLALLSFEWFIRKRNGAY